MSRGFELSFIDRLTKISSLAERMASNRESHTLASSMFGLVRTYTNAWPVRRRRADRV